VRYLLAMVTIKQVARFPSRLRGRLRAEQVIKTFDIMADESKVCDESIMPEGYLKTTIDVLLEAPGITMKMQQSGLRIQPKLEERIYWNWDIPEFIWQAILHSNTLQRLTTNYLGPGVRLDDIYVKTVVDGLQSGAEGWHDDNIGYRLKIFMVFDVEGEPSDTVLIPSKRPNIYRVKILGDAMRMLGGKDVKERDSEVRVSYCPGDCLVFDTNLMHRGDYSTGAGIRFCLVAEFIDREKANRVHNVCPCGPGQSRFSIRIPHGCYNDIASHPLIDPSLLHKDKSGILYGYT